MTKQTFVPSVKEDLNREHKLTLKEDTNEICQKLLV